MALKDWQCRVVEEKNELDEKLNKLNLFIETTKFWDLDNENRTLLRSQASAMSTYSDILARRIALFQEA